MRFARTIVLLAACMMSSRGSSLEASDLLSANKELSAFGFGITFTARTNVVEISKVTVNRGNCSVKDALPKRLLFGEKTAVFASCDPIEAVVETDQGPITFSWDQ